MTKTIERFYDEGKLVREIVTEYEPATNLMTLPVSVPVAPGWAGCTCGIAWNSITPPPPCPTHSNVVYMDDYRRTPPVSI